MDLRQLEIFLTVATELHFGRAADRLFITQQSVSEQVRRLEREVGAPLFARSSRRVELTAAGAALRPEAERALAQARHALATARRAARGGGDTLTVGYAPDAGRTLLRHATALMREQDPGLTIRPVPMGTAAQLDELRDRRLDLGIVWVPELPDELDSLLVEHDPVVLALPRDHDLARGTGPLASTAGVTDVVLWPRDANPRLYDTAVSALVARGAALDTVHAALTLDRQLDMVFAGAATAVTVASVARGRTDDGVVYRPLTGPSSTVDSFLVWHRARTSAGVERFVAIARDHVRAPRASAPGG
jgi:DNA-binding transcriptional LysR family regulator